MTTVSNSTPLQGALKAEGRLICWLMQSIMALVEEVQALRARLAALEKDSTTSHKPPSSDGLKKKRRATRRGSSGIEPTVQEHVFYQTTCECGHCTRLACTRMDLFRHGG